VEYIRDLVRKRPSGEYETLEIKASHDEGLQSGKKPTKNPRYNQEGG